MLRAQLPINMSEVQVALESVQAILIADMMWLMANCSNLVGVAGVGLERCAVGIVDDKTGMRAEGAMTFWADKTYTADDYDPIREQTYGVTVVPTSVRVFFGQDDTDPDTVSLTQ